MVASLKCLVLLGGVVIGYIFFEGELGSIDYYGIALLVNFSMKMDVLILESE